MMRWLIGLAVLAQGVPSVARAQWVDGQLPLAGELQVAISGLSSTVDQRFDPDGQKRMLSEVFGATIDSRLAPELTSMDSVLAGFYPALGLTAPDSSSLGLVQYDVLIEHTRVPISVTYGATSWLAAFAVVPLVKGKSFVATQFDTATADAGHMATAFGGDPNAFLQGLGAGITELESIVTADTLNSSLQAQAEALLADAVTMEAGLRALSGEVYVPTDTGTAGHELTTFYDSMQGDFQTFEIVIPDLALSSPISTTEAVGFTSGPEWGIETPQTRDTGLKFGDIELGLSLQPLNSFRATPQKPRPKLPLRLRLDALYRFATGSPRKAYRLFDPGTGQGQPDLEFRGTLDVAFGWRVWMSLFAGYNMQFAADVERLITTPEAPLQLGAYPTTVRWDPGDVLTLMVAPRLNLTRVITFAGLFQYQRQGRDSFEAIEPIDPAARFFPADLEEGSEYSSSSVGFAARYSTTNWSGDRRKGLPMEVELRYLKTVSSRDGFAPASNVWTVATRFYWGLFR
jgi:hypothetical protein